MYGFGVRSVILNEQLLERTCIVLADRSVEQPLSRPVCQVLKLNIFVVQETVRLSCMS